MKVNTHNIPSIISNLLLYLYLLNFLSNIGLNTFTINTAPIIKKIDDSNAILPWKLYFNDP